MGILIGLGRFLLNILYMFFKLLPTKSKITFLSRQGNSPSVDFLLLKDEISIEMPEYEVVMLCKKLGKGVFSKIRYLFHIFVQMYHIATSKVAVVDSYCIPISLLKHKRSLKVVQIWHALGCCKKFGYSILDKKEGSNAKLAKAMRMHYNYDVILTSGEACVDSFAEAFNYDKDHFRIMPLPRLDLLKDENFKQEAREKILEKYPSLGDVSKKNILYAPTFRKSNEKEDNILKLINSVDYTKYNMVLCCHPLSKISIEDPRIIVPSIFTSLEMSLVCDYVITDYSAFVYEAAFLNKPLFFYTYDMDKYVSGRNFYIDFYTMPGVISEDSDAVMRAIETDQYDMEKIRKFSDAYIKPSNNYTKDIVNMLKELILTR